MKKPFLIPSSLQIAGQEIKINVREFDDELFGQFRFEAKTIDVDVKVAADKKLFMETMRHEIFEACLLLGGAGWCEKMETEAVVRCYDELCYPAIKRLKRAVKLLNP
jgi:hypothetical protein